MENMKSLVPVITDAVVTSVVSIPENITGLITMARMNGIVRRGQLEMVREQTRKALADAKAYNYGSLVITNLEQLSKTQDFIDRLVREGSLHGISLEFALQQLEDLNDMLRQNLRRHFADM